MIVENKPGANSSIATEYVARSKPDGYTMYIGGADVFGSPLYLFKKPPIDPRKDFTYVSPLLDQGFILSVPTDSPYKTVAELTAAMKAKGDKASYPSTNNPALILSEAYKKAAGLPTVQVGYKTSADSSQRHVERTSRLGLVRSGDWACAHPGRQVPPARDFDWKAHLRSAGHPDRGRKLASRHTAMSLWWVTAVPAGTPQPIVDKLNAWWTEIGKMPETREFLAKNGGEPYAGTPAETKALIDKEIADWKGLRPNFGKIEPQ